MYRDYTKCHCIIGSEINSFKDIHSFYTSGLISKGSMMLYIKNEDKINSILGKYHNEMDHYCGALSRFMLEPNGTACGRRSSF